MLFDILEISIMVVGCSLALAGVIAVSIYLIRKRKHEEQETERLLTEKAKLLFPTNGVGQTSQTYEEVKQFMMETTNLTTNQHLCPRASISGDYLAMKYRMYGSISDTLSIARTESYKSRKASTDSGIVGSIGIGSVTPDLYQRRGTIVRRESSPYVSICGTIHCKLLYIFKTSDLMVKIEQVSGIPTSIMSILPTKDKLNPFLIIDIVPVVDQKIRQSSVKFDTFSPMYCETFKFPIAYEELYTHCLWFSIYDFNEEDQSKQKFGKTKLELDAVDPSMEVEIWLDLIVMEPEKRETVGQLLLSLNYLPSVERLTVVVMKAKGIQLMMDPERHFDYFVRINQINNNKIVKKRKTESHKDDNLVWNEVMVFKLTKEKLDNIHLEVKIIQRNSKGNEKNLGDFILGKFSTSSSGKEHWYDIICDYKETFTMWHNLQKDL